MGSLQKHDGSIGSEFFKLRHRLGQFEKGYPIKITLYDDHLMLSSGSTRSKLQPIKLSYSKITDLYYGYMTEIVQKNKSAIGRAFVGEKLNGEVGAIVGALSANGKKQVKQNKLVFIISYTTNTGKVAFLQFDNLKVLGAKKFALTLAELCNIQLKESMTETISEL